jgi:hypothetical protein
MAYDLTDIVFQIQSFTIGPLSLTCSDKAVLNVLATRADKDTHECWPGYGDIAKSAVLSRRAVIDSIKKLYGMGVFKSIRIGGEDSPFSTNHYTLDIDHLKYLAESSSGKPAKAKKKTIRGRDGKTYTVKAESNVTSDGEEPRFDYGIVGGK